MPIKRYHFYNNIKYIDYNLKQLPIPLRNKLFILCMRNFWRTYIPLTAVPPSWYASAVKQQQLLFNAKLDNIHFMHLPCNTLEENKTYIVGCQCSYCKNKIDSKKYLNDNVNQFYDKNYYYSVMPYTDTDCIDEYKLSLISVNNLGLYHLIMGMRNFNPNYEIRKTVKDDINGSPLNFN